MDINIVKADLAEYKSKYNAFDFATLSQFLTNKKRVSHKSYIGYKTNIIRFLRYFDFNKPFHEIDDIDCDDYFNYLESKDLKLSTKNTIRSILKSFFTFYIKKYKRRYGKTLINPIMDKSLHFWELTPTLKNSVTTNSIFDSKTTLIHAFCSILTKTKSLKISLLLEYMPEPH